MASRIRVMNRPPTVNEKPLANSSPMPTRGSTPSATDSATHTSISPPNLDSGYTPVAQLMFLLRLGRLSVGLRPEAVAGAMYENVFQRRLADGNRLNLSRKCLHHIGEEAVAVFALDADFAGEHGSFHREAGAYALGQRLRLVRFQQDHIAADFTLQFRRSAQRHHLALVEDGHAVAFFRFLHQVRGDDDGDVLFIAQNAQVLPQIAARARVKSGGGFVQQQN